MVNSEILENLLTNLAEGVLIIDPDGTVVFCNQNAAELRDVKPADIIGQPVLDCHQPASFEKVLGIVEALRSDPENTHSRVVKAGLKSFEISYSAVTDSGGRFLGVAAVSREVTDKLRLQAELERLSVTDELTDLFNQRHFMNRLAEEIARARRQGRALSLMMMDLDGFKAYNDAHGHPEGDLVLAAAAKVFRNATRQGVDSVFRYGGDEFTILLPESDITQAERTAQRILDAFGEALPETVGLSVGVTELFADDNDRTLLKRSDETLYAAKTSGKNRYLLHPDPHARRTSKDS